MSYIFLQEQGAESSAESFSDIPASVLSRLNLTVSKSYSSASEMASCQSSRSGMMSEPLTANLGADLLMSSAEDFRVRILAQPEAQIDRDLKASAADSGEKWLESFARWCPDLCSWKIQQHSLFGGSELFSQTYPLWGSMQNGALFQQPMLAHDMSVRAYGYWHPVGTPLKTQRSRSADFMSPAKNPFELLPKGFLPCPTWVEKLMGWPDGWTDLRPLVTGKFQQWLRSHGGY